MPYFKSLNLLYIHIPKTGGMSIEEYFYNKCNMVRSEKNIYGYYYNKENRLRVEDERTLQHFTYKEIISKKDFFDIEIGEKNKNMKILVSVRNPFERIVSEICWNKKLGVNENITKDEFYEILYKYLYIDDKDIMDNHKTPQYKFILNENNTMIKENIMIVKTESLKKDMHLLGYHDFDIHINENHLLSRKKINYRELLNEKSVDLILKYYETDFIYFGYSTNLFNEEKSESPNLFTIDNIKKEDKEYKKQQLHNINHVNHNATIVTAFININSKYRSIEDYISFGKKLLKISTPKIVFMDVKSYESYFKEHIHEFPSTHFIMFELTDIYLYKYKHLITDFNLETNNPEKDTMEYIFVQCNKTEWVRTAIELNIFKTNQFIWLDFGIFHMIKDEKILESQVIKMSKSSYSNLRIATCKFRHYVCPYNVYKRLTWNFAGSVFGGDIKSLNTFADIVKTKILETIQTKNTIMWELCFWYLVKDVEPELYNCYICGHDPHILELY